jgi:hypothetical protein
MFLYVFEIITYYDRFDDANLKGPFLRASPPVLLSMSLWIIKLNV